MGGLRLVGFHTCFGSCTSATRHQAASHPGRDSSCCLPRHIRLPAPGFYTRFASTTQEPWTRLGKEST